MLPAQRNKVDISKLTPAEQQAFRLYGKLPSRPVAKAQERKFFDSGDYALAKAGIASMSSLGKERPTPDAIPHASPQPTAPGNASPPTGSPGAIPLGVSTGSPGSGTVSPGHVMGPKEDIASLFIQPGSPTSPSSFGGGGRTSIGFGAETSPKAPKADRQDSGINLSMSPGRIGIGQHVAVTGSPSRAAGTGSFVIASSLSGGGASSPSGAGASASGGVPGHSPTSIGSSLSQPAMVAGTTGNQIGSTQIRRTSQTEGVPIPGATTSPPPRLAQSYSAEDTGEEQVEGMELH